MEDKKRKISIKIVIAICLLVGGLLYAFPIYNYLPMMDNKFYTAEETSYLMFRGNPSHHTQVKEVKEDAEKAFSDLGLSREEAKEKYGLLSRYCITSDYEDVVSEKHKFKVLSVALNEAKSIHLGYMWVKYSQEGLDENGEIVTGSWDVKSLWCLGKDEHGWYIENIKEAP